VPKLALANPMSQALLVPAFGPALVAGIDVSEDAVDRMVTPQPALANDAFRRVALTVSEV
jgi:hypothetical protein